MTENILTNIITKKIERIDFLKKTTSLESLNEIINVSSNELKKACAIIAKSIDAVH